MRNAVIRGGGLQVVLTICVSAAIAWLVTRDPSRSIFTGFLIALSSTAIVLKLLSERGEIDSAPGRMMVGILIFQDLCIVPLMLLVPVLSGGGVDASDIIMKMAKAAAVIAVALLSAKWVVPVVLHQVVHTRSRELFLTTILFLCIGTALLTSEIGLSLALGAFLAGMVISESEYAQQATADILPFRDSFIGMFFVSVGMLMNVGYLFAHAGWVALAVALIFLVKIITGTVSSAASGSPVRAALHAGLGLAHIGEFSFVLALAGRESGLVTEDFYQLFLSSSVITMTAAPFMLKAAPSLSAWITSRPLIAKRASRRRSSASAGFPRKREGHVIIIGFGLNGRNLVRVLKETGIPYVVLDINGDTVREMKKKGEPLYYGDGASSEILHKLGLGGARLLVVAISDPASARRIVSIARHENPGIYIIVRTRYIAEVDDLKALGADTVIPEEFETSIEIFSNVLQAYRFPDNVIYEMAEKVRSDGYTALRKMDLRGGRIFEKCDLLPEMEIDGYRIPGASSLVGSSIGGLQIRKKTGATVIAVRRGESVLPNPAPDFRFDAGDIILFTGERTAMQAALTFFREAGR
jgi:CPA2 family monovalent cation:H+ antiporter-2